MTFTAKVTSAGPSVTTGKVVFADGTTGIGTTALSGGVATLTITVQTAPFTVRTVQTVGDGTGRGKARTRLDSIAPDADY